MSDIKILKEFIFNRNPLNESKRLFPRARHGVYDFGADSPALYNALASEDTEEVQKIIKTLSRGIKGKNVEMSLAYGGAEEIIGKVQSISIKTGKYSEMISGNEFNMDIEIKTDKKTYGVFKDGMMGISIV